MRSALLAAAAMALAAVATADAQEASPSDAPSDAPWAAAMDEGVAAYEQQDWDAAVVAFERAVTATEAPLEKADALRALAIVRMQQNQVDDTLALTERGIETLAGLVEARDETAIYLARQIWLLRMEVFAGLGMDADWEYARRVASDLYGALPQPGWRVEDGVAKHYLSGFECPATVEGLPRTEFITYGPSGADVGCVYGFGADVPGIVSIYFTLRGAEPLEAHVTTTRTEIDMTYGSPQVLEDDEIERSDGAVTRRIVYAKGVTRLPLDFSGAWLTDVGGWTGKVRVSWTGGLDRPFVDRLADSLSVESTGNAWTADCVPVTEAAGESADPAEAVGAVVALTAMGLLFDETEGEVGRPAPGAIVESDACWLGSLQTQQGEIVVRRLRELQGGVTLIAAPMQWRPDQPWFAAVSTGLLEDEAVYLAELSPDGSTVWAAFDGQPSDDQFGEVLAEVLRGERSPLARMAGDTIQVSVPEAE